MQIKNKRRNFFFVLSFEYNTFENQNWENSMHNLGENERGGKGFCVLFLKMLWELPIVLVIRKEKKNSSKKQINQEED